jgi:hypothetical protein
MVMPYLVHESMMAVVEPLFAALLRLAGVPGRLPQSNEDCVWY